MSVRIALAGYGYWGPNLARIIAQLDNAELIAVHDPILERSLDVKKRHPSVCFLESWEEVCDSSRFDALILATPAETHYKLAAAALKSGLDVLVEKPLALSTQEAFQLVRLSEESGRILMVGHTYEFNPAVERMRELAERGDLGDLFYGYSLRVNLGRIREDIDAWWNLAPHDVSIFNFLFQSAPVRVWAQSSSHIHPERADVVFATLQYPGNITSHIHVSWLDPCKERKLTLVGSERMVVFDDMSADARLRVFDKKAVPSEEPSAYGLYHTKLHAGDILIPKLPLVEPLAAECEHFLHCVQTRDIPRSDGFSGARTVQVLEAVTDSIDQGGIPIEITQMNPGLPQETETVSTW